MSSTSNSTRWALAAVQAALSESNEDQVHLSYNSARGDDAPLGEQVEGVATAIAYYLLSAARVDALQVFGTDGFGSSLTYAEDAPAMERDIEATVGLINAGVESLKNLGVDIGGAAWSAEWAKGLSQNQSATQNSASANAFALTEIWFSAVSVQMLTAARSS